MQQFLCNKIKIVDVIHETAVDDASGMNWT